MNIDKRKLLASGRRDRYVEELNEHAEDTGKIDQLGSTDELITAFNMYTTERRKHILLFAVKVAVITFFMQILLMALAASMAGAHQNPSPFLTIPMLIFSLPTQVIAIPVFIIANQLGEVSTEQVGTTVTGLRLVTPIFPVLVWTPLITLIRFPPRLKIRQSNPK